MSYAEISVGELADRLAAGASLIDVRQAAEFVAGHVPGAVLIPLNELADRASEVPVADEVLVICKSGGRSAQACEWLAANGVRAANVLGGTMAWIQDGRPVDTEL